MPHTPDPDDVKSRRSVADIVRDLPPAPGPLDTAPVLAPGAHKGDIVVPRILLPPDENQRQEE
jgi:hypothetical protein